MTRHSRVGAKKLRNTELEKKREEGAEVRDISVTLERDWGVCKLPALKGRVE